MPPFSRELIAASASLLILNILTNGRNYGYRIIKHIQALTEGRLELSEGSLYPQLHRLEAQGYIKSEWIEFENGRKRKYYAITNEGLTEASNQWQNWQKMTEALTNSAHGGEDICSD